MNNLAAFEAPNPEEVAVSVVDGRAHYLCSNLADFTSFTNAVENHPKIHILRDQLHHSGSKDEGRALFLPVNVPFLKQLSQVYYEEGALEALHLAESERKFPISQAATFILSIHAVVTKFRLLLNPNMRYSGPTLIGQLGQTRDWNRSIIRCLSWHPYQTKLAVATCDDTVRIYSSDSSNPTILRCKRQTNITSIAWRPRSNTDLAVAHEDGIIVWNVDPNSIISRPSLSTAIILYRLNHRPVMSISWSPKGDMLVSMSACDNTILVWDPELDRTSLLKRPGGHGNVLGKWSPTGEKLFTCSDGIIFRVWDSRNWECERWTLPQGRIQSGCWTNCGTTLIFATNSDPIIYGVIVKNDLIFTSDSDSSSNQALAVFDVTKLDLDGATVGGRIQSMESDPTGHNLAVMFAETNYVAVFGIVRKPALQLLPCALISGDPAEKPSVISFQENNSCLTIGWSSGRIQYFPILTTKPNPVINESYSINKPMYKSFNGSLAF